MTWKQELDALPTLRQGWNGDLKDETDGLRVWLERTSIEDGEPYVHTVSVERYDGDRWETVGTYDGDRPAPEWWAGR